MAIEDYLADLPKIAEEMKRLKRDEQAVPSYELLSGSLIWSDEFPKDPKVSTHCLRFVFRYSLILGEPETHYEIFWNRARQHFPEWIGFAPDRTSPSSDLAALYISEKEQALRRFS
jgi:hypothetical protein